MRKDFEKIINEIANDNNVTPSEVKAEMQKVLDESWGDPTKVVTKLHHQFNLIKPTLEDFFYTILAAHLV